MAQQWLVKRPQEAGAPVPPVDSVLPNAILGTPVLTTSFSTDQNHQLLIDVTIPVSWPGGNKGDVDRLIVHLYAPDTAVDTQETFVGGPGTGGETPGIIIGDASEASKIVSIESSAIQIEKAWDAKRPFVHFQQPAPTEPEWWRAIVVSASKTAKNKVDTSPSVRFHVGPQGPDVSGVEYAPLALNFHLLDAAGNVSDLPRFDVAEGGGAIWGFTAVWENDVKDPRFAVLGGYDVDIEYPNGNRETTTSKSSNDLRHDSDMWPIGAAADFTIYIVSWSSQAGNPRNSIVPGLTPSITFHVEAPEGPSGSEHATRITNFRLVNPYYGKNGQGQKTLYLPLFWDKPTDDRSFGGAVIAMIRGDGIHYTLTGLETGTSQIVQLLQFPPAGISEAVTLYILSVSTSGEKNTYQPGFPGIADATPAIAFMLQGPAESTPVVSAVSATVFYDKDEFGNNVYGYSGSWANPNAALWPEFQGVKVYKADAAASSASRVQLTGVITDGVFKTQGWPLKVESAIYLYFISVDVNGVERSFVSPTPRIGPLFVTAQGGTITNAALPDLNVADFAAGVEPLTFMNLLADTRGVIVPQPGTGGVWPAKTTTERFNNQDQRLYRWHTAYAAESGVGGAYKVVGSALDIDANTIVAGLIRVGAIVSQHMAGNELLIGLPPSAAPVDRAPIIRVNKQNSTDLLAFLGTYAGFEGLYALNLRIGPNFADPMLEATAAGLFLRGTAAKPISFELTAGGGGDNYYIRMNTVTFDPTYASLAILVSNVANSNQTYHISRGVVVYEGAFQIAALARNPTAGVFGGAGELALYGTDHLLKIYATAKSPYNTAAYGYLMVRDELELGPTGVYKARGKSGTTTSGYFVVNAIEVTGGIVTGLS